MGITCANLRRRITIQQRVSGEDALGQPSQSWQSLAEVWADIRLPSGIEGVRADAIVSTVRASIRIRYRTDVTAGMRVLHGSTVYDVRAVLPDIAGQQHLDLVCEASQ